MQIFTFEIEKLYPKQNYSSPPFEIKVTNSSIDEIIDKNIIVRVLSDSGTVEESFPISGLITRIKYGDKQLVTREDFLSKYSR
ncbi:hypothetical protein GO730_05720 [Spirosoma sp. HMF3257]|uniref:Uncharacterized protein n=1 Tax=Spirosoma telluris TaxID=2183553 RepID=A0A327NGM0_9BACT|nr:hypothetical protein [Spirosoma telluris]RAI73975.1 hypothetical protein HMF3257_05685 [Spirosoma telluris]